MLYQNEKGELIFICSKCFSIIHVSGIKNEASYDFHSPIGGFYSWRDASFNFCPVCYEEDERGLVVFNCDPEIAEDIVIMNKKGYETSFSCSSHNEQDTDFYVVFKVPYKSHIKDIKNIFTVWKPEYDIFLFEEFRGRIAMHTRKEYVVRNWVERPDEPGIYDMEPLEHEEWIKRHKKHLEIFHDMVKCLKSYTAEDTSIINHLYVDVRHKNKDLYKKNKKVGIQK